QSRPHRSAVPRTASFARGRRPMGWIDSIPLPALRVDGGGRVEECNRLAAKLFDLGAEGLVGRDRFALRVAGDGAEPARAVAEIPVERGALLLFADGGVIERLQQQVYHLSRLASAGKLVAVVVHEINNALSGILGYAQFLLA